MKLLMVPKYRHISDILSFLKINKIFHCKERIQNESKVYCILGLQHEQSVCLPTEDCEIWIRKITDVINDYFPEFSEVVSSLKQYLIINNLKFVYFLCARNLDLSRPAGPRT